MIAVGSGGGTQAARSCDARRLGCAEALGTGYWTEVQFGSRCIGHRHRGSGSAGTLSGCWRAAGRPYRWPRRWRATPTRLANGWRPFGRLGRLVSRSSPLAGPPAFGSQQQAELKAAVQAPPTAAGIDLADWNWKVVWEFVQRRFGSTLSRSSCLNYLHRLDFVLKRPKKRLVKANAERRAAFVREYALLRAAAQATGATLFFADEAHFLCGRGPARQVGAAGRASPGGVDQPALGREGQLLLGCVSANRGGGGHGTGRHQHCHDFGGLPATKCGRTIPRR